MDKKDIRRANLQILQRALMDLGQATKPQLAEATGFSVVTVNALLKELVEAGAAEAVAAAAPGEAGGRPAQQFAYCRNRKLVLLLYMFEEQGRDKLVLAVENLLGEVIWQKDVFPDVVTEAVLLANLQDAIKEFPQVSQVLLGLPGVEVAGKMLVIDYPELRDLTLTFDLSKNLGMPVHFCNDINAAVMGYGRTCPKADEETIVGLYWPHGYPPGAGILLKRRLYTGRDGIAGEVGCRFSSGESYHEEDFSQMATAEIIRLVRYWNPHRLVIYREGLTDGELAGILTACKSDLPRELLPQVKLGVSFAQDYVAGLQQIGRELICNEGGC